MRKDVFNILTRPVINGEDDSTAKKLTTKGRKIFGAAYTSKYRILADVDGKTCAIIGFSPACTEARGVKVLKIDGIATTRNISSINAETVSEILIKNVAVVLWDECGQGCVVADVGQDEPDGKRLMEQIGWDVLQPTRDKKDRYLWWVPDANAEADPT